MQLLLEKHGWVDESFVNQLHAKEYDSIFKKIDIYSNNVRKGLINENSKYIDKDIFFTTDEQEAINDMLIAFKHQLLETAHLRYDLTLDEGLLNWGKEKYNKLKSEVKDKIGQAKDQLDKSKEIGKKIKAAFDFICEAIKKGFKKVSELLKFFKQWLFEKLGDTLRESIEALGLIGDGRSEVEKDAEKLEATLNDNAQHRYTYLEYLAESKKEEKKKEEKKDSVSDKDLLKSFEEASKNIKSVSLEKGDDYTQGLDKKGEKDFYNALLAAVKAKSKEGVPDAEEAVKDIEGEVNEGAFSFIVNAIQKNELFQKISNSEVVKKIKGNKILRFLAMTLIGIISSIIVMQALPVFLSMIAIALGATANGMLVTMILIVVRVIWSSRAVWKVLINRYKEWKHAKETGDKDKFVTKKLAFDLGVQLIILCATSAIPMGTIMEYIQKIPLLGDVVNLVGDGFGKVVGSIQDVILKVTNNIGQNVISSFVGPEAAEKIASQAFENCGLAGWFSKNVSDKYYGSTETKVQADKMSDEEKVEQHRKFEEGETEHLKVDGEDVEINVAKAKGKEGLSAGFSGDQREIKKLDTTKIVSKAGLKGELEIVPNVANGKTAYTYLLDGKPVTKVADFKQITGAIQLETGMSGQVVQGVPKISQVFKPANLGPDLFPLAFSPFPRFKDAAVWLSRSNASLSKKFEGNLKNSMTLELTYKDLLEKSENAPALEKLKDVYEKLKEEAKARVREDKKALKKIEKIDINDNKLLVMFAKVDDKNVPFFAFAYDTFKFIDCFKAKEGETKNNKERVNLLDINGLFSHLNIIPKEAHDTETKDKIFDLLANYLKKAAQTMADKYYLPIKVKEAEDDKKGLSLLKNDKGTFIPSEKIKDEKEWRKTYGFTLDEICNILNTDREKVTPEFREFTNKVFSGKRNKENVTIEDKENYIKKKLFPILSGDNKVSKAIKNEDRYKELKKWLYDDEGKFKEDAIIPESTDYLFRIMTSYSLDTTRSWKDWFKKHNDEEEQMNKNLKALSELLWNYKESSDKEKKEKIEKSWSQKKVKNAESNDQKEATNAADKANEIGKSSMKFAEGMIRRFDVDDNKSDAHKEFVKEAQKNCPLLYKDGKLNEEIVKSRYVASILKRLFNTSKYYKEESYDDTAKTKIEKAVDKYYSSDDKDKMKETVFNAYKMIKDKKRAKEYRGLKEGYVSDFGDFMLFEEESFNPYAPAKKKVLSFEDFLKTKK